MHPVLVELQARGLSQSWLVDRITDLGHPVTAAHVSYVLSGRRRPSPRLSEAMSKALDGAVSPSAIVFWKTAEDKQ